MDSKMLEKIERQRQALEENIAKLRTSLRHWQNLELDYEGLREEFQMLPDDSSKNECLRVARDFKPIVIDEKDLLSLMGDTKSASRSPPQLCDLLSKRVDYVSRNADTIRKHIAAEEKKVNALLLVEDPKTRDDAGLPLSEITEELDDDGNVISSKVERPGTGAAGLAEVLEKAGVEGIRNNCEKIEATEEEPSAEATVASSGNASAPVPELEDSDQSEHDSTNNDDSLSAQLPVRIPIPGDNPIPVQIRDTEEEARIRKEMLEYGLNEVGAIVAELDLQEGESDVSYDEDEENFIIDSEFDDEDDEDGSEDEFGRVKNPRISEKYKDKMEELGKRFGLTDLKNLGPTPELPPIVQEALDRPTAAEAARKAAIARDDAASGEVPLPKKNKKPRKNVAFAEELDVAKEPPAKRKADDIKDDAVNPMGEAVIERPSDQITDPPPPPVPTRTNPASRFKATRIPVGKPDAIAPTQVRAIPPSNKDQNIGSELSKDRPLVAPNVLERPTASSSVPPDPDAIDDEMHRREIAIEYHKLRNRKIHAQGGFVRDHGSDDEDFEELLGNNLLVDEETGEVKKVSRFKAARLMR